MKLMSIHLTAFIDGASRGNPGEAAFGVLIYRDGNLECRCGQRLGIATNNVAEYFACIMSLIECGKLGADVVTVYSDSQLLVKQVTGEYRIKDDWLKRLNAVITELRGLFTRVEFVHIPREKNREADAFVNSLYPVKSADSADLFLSR